MVSCAVARCKNSSAKSTKCKNGITFHRFPQDEHRRKTWEISVNREPEWVATDSSTVCSEHFEVRDFYYTESGLRRLSVDAIPTINISVCEPQQPTISSETHIDIKPTDMEEVIQLKHKVSRLEAIAKKRKKQINLMLKSRKRMQTKMDLMKAVIKNLVYKE